VQNAGVQKARRDKPPPLSSHDGRCIFDARIGEPLLRQVLAQEENHIDRQHHDAGSIGARDEASGEAGWAHIDGPRSQLNVAVRTHSIANCYKGPAIRAHPPIFHRLIVAGTSKSALGKIVCG
jgi:hypothetical protein